jgi:hypothetical protein
MPSDWILGWAPAGVKKTRQIQNEKFALEPSFNS